MEAAGLIVAGDKAAPLTVNAEMLRATGLIGSLRQPVKILGEGEVDRPLFVVADAFTKSARQKIEAAGGTAQALVVPTESLPAIGLDATDEPAVAVTDDGGAEAPKPRKAKKAAKAEAAEPDTTVAEEPAAEDAATEADATEAGQTKPARRKAAKAPDAVADASAEAPVAEASVDAAPDVEAEADAAPSPKAKAKPKPSRKRTTTESAE
jgi:hypothetical protein